MTGREGIFLPCFRWHIDNFNFTLYDVGNYKPFYGLFMLQTIIYIILSSKTILGPF